MEFWRVVNGRVVEFAADCDILRIFPSLSKEIAFRLLERAEEILRSRPTVILGKELRLAQGLVTVANAVMVEEAKENGQIPENKIEGVLSDPWTTATGLIPTRSLSESSFCSAYSISNAMWSSIEDMSSTHENSYRSGPSSTSSLSSVSQDQPSRWDQNLRNYITDRIQYYTGKSDFLMSAHSRSKRSQSVINDKNWTYKVWFRNAFQSLLRKMPSLRMRTSSNPTAPDKIPLSLTVDSDSMEYPYQFDNYTTRSRFSFHRIRDRLANIPNSLRRTKSWLLRSIRRIRTNNIVIRMK